MARLFYSNHPLEKQEHIRRRKFLYKLNKRLLIISLITNAVLLAYVIIKLGV